MDGDAHRLIESPLGVAEAEQVEDEDPMSACQDWNDLPPDRAPARRPVYKHDGGSGSKDTKRDLTDRGPRALRQSERHGAEAIGPRSRAWPCVASATVARSRSGQSGDRGGLCLSQFARRLPRETQLARDIGDAAVLTNERDAYESCCGYGAGIAVDLSVGA